MNRDNNKNNTSSKANKNKRLIYFSIPLFILAALLLILRPWGTRPFANLSPEEIVSAEFFLVPPDITIHLTDREDIEELCEILKGLVVYREDDSGREYAGQLVQATITLQDGIIHTVGAYGSFLFLDGKCHRTKYEPSERMNSFGNRLRYSE